MSYKTLFSDPGLFDAFRRGDQRAFTKVYEAFKRAVYTTALRFVGSAEDAEDLTVQTFAKVWERRESIRELDHIRNILFITARNCSIDFLRAKGRSRIDLLPTLPEEMHVEDLSAERTDQLFAELVETIMDIVKRMPRLRGMVFRMRYLEERAVKDVAEELGLSIHSVYWHSKEALAQIRHALADKAPRLSKAIVLILLLSNSGLIQALF